LRKQQAIWDRICPSCSALEERDGHTVLAVAVDDYHTSKGAVVNFTRALAGDWGRHGITVNALAPGFFPSKMTKGTLEAVGADKLAAGAPLGRIGDQDDLKGAAVLFASDAGKHITGQILAVDGGLTAVLPSA
jgi:NAD(P)-dependent dehydrogenase (short-subunit alcohol dehydrogenase family)